MSESQISFYEKRNGACPVLQFLDTLPQGEKTDIAAMLISLNEQDYIAQRQYIRHLRGNLWEIRIRCYRIIFSYQHGYMLLLRGFHKKTKKTPDKQMESAQKYLKDYLDRGVK